MKNTGGFISKTFITNKTMSNRIIESSVGSKYVNNTCHIESSASKHTKHTTIISTKTANDTLQLSTVKCPLSTMFIHVDFKLFIRRSPKPMEILSTSISIHVDSDLMLVGFVDLSVLHTSGRGCLCRVSTLKTPWKTPRETVSASTKRSISLVVISC